MEVLGVEPGSVTPFAPHQRHRPAAITVILDERDDGRRRVSTTIRSRNDATTTIASADLVAFIRACGHEPRILSALSEPHVVNLAGRSAI